MARVDRVISPTSNTHFNGGGIDYLVETPSGVLYLFYVNGLSDAAYMKSTDGGLTWSAGTTLKGGTVSQLSVWYDRWSGIAADLIHIVYTEDTVDDVLYVNMNAASSDTLSSETTVFAGATTANGGGLSITRARGGNLVVAYMIDAGTELGHAKSTDVGATWGAITSGLEAASDQFLMLPGWNADTQDVQMVFWDASTDELTIKRYDDSGNSWAESAAISTMVETAITTDFPHFAATVDLTNSRNIVAAWSARDAASAVLRVYRVDDTNFTAVTSAVTSSTDDQGFAALAIDTTTDTLYIFYCGATAGTETMNTSIKVYYKTSTDFGTTWSAEAAWTNSLASRRVLMTTPRCPGTPSVASLVIDANIPLWELSYDLSTGGAGVVASLSIGI